MSRTKQYNLRIAVYDTCKGRNACVALCDEARTMFTKPYVTIRRMQDRLAFVPCDVKTGRGAVAVRDNKIQVGVKADCDKMLDFCGEYDVVNRTENGMVFVKLSDKKDYSLTLPPQRGRFVNYNTKHKSSSDTTATTAVVATNVETPTMSLTEMLETAIQQLRDEEKQCDDERKQLEARREALLEKIAKLDDAITTYQLALAVAKGEQ